MALAEAIVPGVTTGHASAHEQLNAKFNFGDSLPVINPCHPAYGAVGDGVADDTSALQSAINDCISSGPTDEVRTAVARLYLPAGKRFLVMVPVRVVSVVGFDMRAGGYSSAIVAGADMECPLDLNGVAQSHFSGFRLTGVSAATVDRALWLRWGAGIGRSTADNHFEDITIDGLDYIRGVQIGEDGAVNQVNSDTWVNCVARGDWYDTEDEELWEAGFYVGSGVTSNNVIHTFLGCTAESNRHNLHNAATSVAWHGGALSYGESDLRLSGHGSYFVVEAMRSELSQRLLTTEGPNGTAASVTLRSIEWYPTNLPEDDEFVRWNHGGNLKIENLQLPPAEGKSPKIVAEGGIPPYTIDVDGVSTTTPVDEFVEAPSGVLTIRNHDRVSAEGVSEEVTAHVTSGPVHLSDETGSVDVAVKRVSDGVIGTKGQLVADEEGAGGGVHIYDDGFGHISPRGGSPRPLVLDGWTQVSAPATIVQDSVELANPGNIFIAYSPDGTRYKLAPPNGGGAATWIAF